MIWNVSRRMTLSLGKGKQGAKSAAKTQAQAPKPSGKENKASGKSNAKTVNFVISSSLLGSRKRPSLSIKRTNPLNNQPRILLQLRTSTSLCMLQFRPTLLLIRRKSGKKRKADDSAVSTPDAVQPSSGRKKARKKWRAWLASACCHAMWWSN